MWLEKKGGEKVTDEVKRDNGEGLGLQGTGTITTDGNGSGR